MCSALAADEEKEMKKREIIKTIRGDATTDGAGVKLVRVLSHANTVDFDPFLMLDFFDSTDPSDYTKGFPMHPHRGIETITYMIEGRIEHEDSLGNKGSIQAGESQWMTAGSGILHQEMPKASERMLGIQLWLNLPRNQKMTSPAYLSITGEMIAQTKKDGAIIRVLSGQFEHETGVTPRHIPASIYDIELSAGGEISIPTKPEETVFVFVIGDAVINGQTISSHTAVLFGEGDELRVCASAYDGLRFFFFSGKPLHEPIAWGGPIVMNTEEELAFAFDELRRGTFIKHS